MDLIQTLYILMKQSKAYAISKIRLLGPTLLLATSYYDDVNGAENFEEHATHHHHFLGDKLIIEKIYAIVKGVEFVMNRANHRMCSVTTYPFNIMGHGWEKCTPTLDELPLKGDTVAGNDVWIGMSP